MPGFVEQTLRGVTLVHWTPDPDTSDRAGRIENFGDALGPKIARGLAPDREATEPRTLLTIGSAIHAAEPGAVVWGAGVNAKLRRPLPARPETLDVRAVRGPLTRAALVAAGARVPAVYGDPGLLLPRVFPEVEARRPRSPSGVVVIPNLNELEYWADDSRVVSPLTGLWDVVDAVLSAELVVGSSLHGIMLADALGIPARFVVARAEHPFKYADYLLGTGRPETMIAASVEDAVALGGHEPPLVDLDALEATFPADLWAGTRAPSRAGGTGAEAMAEALATANRAAAVGAAELAGAVLSVAVVPGLARFADELAEEALRASCASTRGLIGSGVAVGSFPWGNEHIASLIRAGDTDALRRVSLAARSRDGVRIEHARLDGDRLVLTGLATPHLAHLTPDSATVTVTRVGEHAAAPLKVESTALAGDPSARWHASLSLDELRAYEEPIEVRVVWRKSGQDHISRPAVGPRLRHARLGALEGAGVHVRVDDSANVAIDATRSAPEPAGPAPSPAKGGADWLSADGPALSVVIPCHNVAEWLDDLLESVLRQDVDGMEVIAVNDHSTDATAEVLARFASRDPRLRVIEPEARGGANARNVGVAASSGKYVIFADSDDLVPPGAYRALVESLERSGSDIAFGDYLKFNANRTWRPTTNWRAFSGTHESIRLASEPTLIRGRACWNKAFRRDFWIENGLEFPEVARSNDIQPMVRAYLAADKVDVIGEVVYIYRQRPGGTSMTSRASLGAGLASYLGQELVCARLLHESGEPALLAEYSSLFLGSDGWVHLRNFAKATLGTDTPVPAEAVDALAQILRLLDPVKIAREPHSRLVPTRLFAAGACDDAQIIMRDPGEQTTDDESGLRVLSAWVTALEVLGDSEDDALVTTWEKEIAPRVLGDVPFPTAERALPILRRLAALSESGRAGVDRSTSPGVARMRAILERLDTPDGTLWLETRASVALTADDVRRGDGVLEISGPLDDVADVVGVSVAPYYSGDRHGHPVAVRTSVEGGRARWHASVPYRSVHRGSATRVRAEHTAAPGMTVDVPVLLAPDASLPTNARLDPVAVFAAATAGAPALELKRNAGVARRAARAAMREARSFVKARVR